MAVKKIRKYGICAANTDGELAAFVNQQIKQGWEPYGFVFTSVQQEQLFFHQAMIFCGKVEMVQRRVKPPGKWKTI